MSAPRPYHHGNVRSALLDHAATMIRTRGAAQLSLRELSSEIGITHAAPRRYFPDRQALLDALAVEGFARLGAQLRTAAGASREFREQLRALASAYLDFTVAEANLVELMFAHKHGPDGSPIAQSAASAFAPIQDAFALAEARAAGPERDPEQGALLFLATLQGIAGLANCGVVQPAQLGELIDQTVSRFSESRARSD